MQVGYSHWYFVILLFFSCSLHTMTCLHSKLLVEMACLQHFMVSTHTCPIRQVVLTCCVWNTCPKKGSKSFLEISREQYFHHFHLVLFLHYIYYFFTFHVLKCNYETIHFFGEKRWRGFEDHFKIGCQAVLIQIKVDSMQPPFTWISLAPESCLFQGVVVHSVEKLPRPSDKDFCSLGWV